jgi:hypothetical protein
MRNVLDKNVNAYSEVHCPLGLKLTMDPDPVSGFVRLFSMKKKIDGTFAKDAIQQTKSFRKGRQQK